MLVSQARQGAELNTGKKSHELKLPFLVLCFHSIAAPISHFVFFLTLTQIKENSKLIFFSP